MNIHRLSENGVATPVEMDCPRWDFAKGDIVSLGAPRDHTLRRLEFERAIPGVTSLSGVIKADRLLRFAEIPSGLTITLSDQEIAFLFKEGRFRIELIDESTGEPRGVLPTNLDLTETERAYVERHWPYIEAFQNLKDDFLVSRIRLDPIVAEVNARLGGKPISTSTALRLFEKWTVGGSIYGRAAIVPKRGRGNRNRPWSNVVLEALRIRIYRVLVMPKGEAKDVESLMRVWSDEEYPNTAIALPSLRTIQRETGKINKYVKDFLRKGPGYAARKHGSYYERPRPELPLEEVEVDHTTFDIRLIDDVSGIVLGRPDVVTIRDRRSGMCLGFAIGWEVPSYTSFLEAVRHAMYPKDLSAYPNLKHSWPCFGRWKRMFVDNGLHFLGLNIAHAAAELGFEVVELKPGEPWMKGAQERLFGILNRKVAHMVPGTTLSNIAERKDYEEALEPPALTLREFEAFLVSYIVDDYHCRKHDGLGPLRALPDVPMRLWQTEIHRVKQRSLPHPDTFASLAGDIAERTVQHYGIDWDNIQYQSDTLISLRIHPLHKAGKGAHRGTKYRVTRDPQDLGQIWVFDPYAKSRIAVPAVRQDYASGLTLHQHAVIQAHHQRTVGKFVDIDGLLRARAALFEAIEAVRRSRVHHGVERLMARFLGKEAAKRVRSIVQPKNDSSTVSADPLDLEDPIGVLKPEPRSPRAQQSNRRHRPADPDSVDQFAIADDGSATPIERPIIRDHPTEDPAPHPPDNRTDIDALRSRHSDWDDI